MTYGVTLEGAARDDDDAMQAWVADAVAEVERIEKLERDE